MAFSNYIWKPFQILLIDRCQLFSAICFVWIDWPTSQETNMAEYMERNVPLIRNLIEDNKTYKHVSEILRQNFPEVTRGFSERKVRLFCAKYGIRWLNEFEVDSIVQDCVNDVSLFLFLRFVWIGTFHFYSCLPLWMSKFLPPHFFGGKKLFLSHHFCRSLWKRIPSYSLSAEDTHP